MSTSEPFLPVPGEDTALDDAPLEREDHDEEDENEPDIFSGPSDDAQDATDEPPVADHTVFRTPAGDSADPAKD
ncbi:hypothetical protein ACFXQA_06395 [Microbacterium sp. P07]|uniref:hypothetical protein n=1 Tax=Microbacterium sp. P07 TaxID=3366952 RepID=UPI0037462A7C